MEEQLDQPAAEPQGDSVYDAAAAIEAILKGPGTSEQQAAPATTQTQPQAEAQPAQEEVAPASEEVQAPASEVPAPVAEQPKAPDASSPELDVRLGEADKAKQEATAARDQYLNTLNTLVPQFEAAIRGEFADIKTQDDLLALGATDPERYNRAVIAFTKLANANTARQQAQAAVDRDNQAAEQTRRSAEVQKLVKAIPELGNPETGPALEAKLRAFAQTKGIDPQRISNWGASEVVLLHDAMKAAGLAPALAEAQKKAAKAPPVQQPGTTRENNKDEKVNEDFARLQKRGDLHSAAAVFRNFL